MLEVAQAASGDLEARRCAADESSSLELAITFLQLFGKKGVVSMPMVPALRQGG